MRIDIIVVLDIVFMIRRRDKERIKVDCIYPKPLQIIHLIQNALQIAPVKLPDSHGPGVLIPTFSMYSLVADVLIFVI